MTAVTTIADLNRAYAAGLALNIANHHKLRHLIVAVTPCTGRCPNIRDGLICVAVVDLELVGAPATAVDRCHVAESYELPIVADTLPVAA